MKMKLKKRHPMGFMNIDDTQTVEALPKEIELTDKVKHEMTQPWFKVWVEVIKAERKVAKKKQTKNKGE